MDKQNKMNFQMFDKNVKFNQSPNTKPNFNCYGSGNGFGISSGVEHRINDNWSVNANANYQKSFGFKPSYGGSIGASYKF